MPRNRHVRLDSQVPVITWTIVVAGIAVTCVLGYLGFGDYYAARNQQQTWLDLTYRTLQLFSLGSGSVSGPIPWELQTARFLAPLVAGLTIVRALMLLFRSEIDRLRIQLLRDHVLVCGLSAEGLAITEALCDLGRRVVVIEQDEEEDRIQSALDAGAFVTTGDAREAAALGRANLRRAACLVATCGNDIVNAEATLRARQTRATLGVTTQLRCLVHISNRAICLAMRAYELQLSSETPTIEFFNVYDRAARVLAEAIIANHFKSPCVSKLELLCLGNGRFLRHLLLEFERRMRSSFAPESDEPNLRLTVLTDEAGASFVERVGGLPGARICTLPELLDSPQFWRREVLTDDAGRPRFDSVLVTAERDTDAIALGLAFTRHPMPENPSVVVCLEHLAGVARMLGELDDKASGLGSVTAFEILTNGCTEDLLSAGTSELVARAIHEHYRRIATPEGEAATPAWDDLPESLKISNRLQARDIVAKLGRVSCNVVPHFAADPLFAFRPEEVESLAIWEHRRWLRDRRRHGWQLGRTREPERLRSPYMIPWAELKEDVRELDRQFVRFLPQALATVGLGIARLTTNGAEDEH